MPRGVVQNGVIYPVEPLPYDWHDGTEVRVVKSSRANGAARPSPARAFDPCHHSPPVCFRSAENRAAPWEPVTGM